MEKAKLEKIQVLMEGLDENSIVSVLDKWKEINEVKNQLEEWDNVLREKVKTHLKERKWDEYLCNENKINVTLRTEKREVIDKRQIKMLLTPMQLAQVTHMTTFERLTITTPEMREKMKKFFKRKAR